MKLAPLDPMRETIKNYRQKVVSCSFLLHVLFSLSFSDYLVSVIQVQCKSCSPSQMHVVSEFLPCKSAIHGL